MATSTSTQDLAVSSLPFHSGSYADHYVIAYRSGTDDTGRILASTLFNDNVISTVNVTAPITGDGFGTPLELQLNTNAISIDTYFADDSVTNPKISTIDRSKFNQDTDTNGNWVTIASNTQFSSIPDPLTGIDNIGFEVYVASEFMREIDFYGIQAGTNCTTSSNATEITINNTATGSRYGIGIANQPVNTVADINLATGNVFDITINPSVSTFYITFRNFFSDVRGKLITIRLNITAAVEVLFEDAEIGGNTEFNFNLSSNTAFVAYIDDTEDYIVLLSQNTDLF